MKSDISRDSFRPDARFSAVLLQQGRPLSDADWNEAEDIQRYQRRTRLRDAYGASGLPQGSSGFQLSAAGGDLEIAAGRMYVNGVLAELRETALYTAQPDLPGLSLPGDGLYFAYLDVWERGISAINSPDAPGEIALGGVDTSRRLQGLAQVKLVRVGDGTQDLPNFEPQPPEYSAIAGRTVARLRARTRSADISSDPCEIGARGGYASQTNRVYRVEIHTAGPGGAGGTATFKWSRDNGTVAARVREFGEDFIVIQSAGRDRELSFRAGDWIEIGDERREQAGEPGTLARVSRLDSETLFLDPDSYRHFDGSAGPERELLASDFNGGPVFVRRWDMPDAAGAVPVPAEGEWLSLENGIEISFERGTGQAEYQNGEAWQIPARAASGDIIWPRDGAGLPLPQDSRPDHHYAPLAFVRILGGVSEIRADLRSSLSDLSSPELHYAGGDGQRIAAGESVPVPLSLQIRAGAQPVEAARVRLEILTGTGELLEYPGGASLGSTVEIASDADGMLRVGWRPDALLATQSVRAILLEPDGVTPSPYRVEFRAALKLAGENEYSGSVLDPNGAELMSGVTRIDQALDRLGEIKLNRSGGTITGSLGVDGNMSVAGDLEVRGDVEIVAPVPQSGQIDLGNADADRLIIHAELESRNGSDRLEIADAVRVEANVDAVGRIGVGTAAPANQFSSRGLVDIQSGGMVFPDGSIQTTADSGGAGGLPASACVAGDNPFAPDQFLAETTELLPNPVESRRFGAWSARTGLAVARSGAAVGVLADRIYVVGGSQSGTGGRTENEIYDPRSDRISSAAPLPVATGHLAGTVHSDRLYVFGGSTWSGSTLTGVTAATRVYDPRADRWDSLADLPVARSGAVALSYGEHIFVLGGATDPVSGTALDSHHRFDPLANRWSARADLPTPRTDMAAAVWRGQLFVFGGNAVTASGLDVTEVYDPLTDAWQSRAPMPTARFGMIAVVIDDMIHVIGGTDAGADLDVYEIYDPLSDSWSSRDAAGLLTLRHAGVGALVDRTIYHIGGQSQSGSDLTTIEAYAPGGGLPVHCRGEAPEPAPVPAVRLDWTALANLPISRTGGMGGAVAGQIYFTGGHDAAIVHSNETYAFDPVAGSWSARTAMPTTRAYAASMVRGGRLHVIGGNTGGNQFGTHEVYDAATNTWLLLAEMPTPRFYCSGALASNDRLYVCGGTRNSSENLVVVEEYDPTTNTWRGRANLITAARMPAVTAAGDLVFAFGGINNAAVHNRNQAYDPATNSWQLRAPMPTIRYGATAHYISGEIYVLGGTLASATATNLVEVYNPQTDTWRTGEAIPTTRNLPQGALLGQTLYLTGGGAPDPQALVAHEAISFPARSARLPLPAARSGLAGGSLDQAELLLVCGGRDDTSGNAATPNGDCYGYEPAENTWLVRSALGTPRADAASAVAGGRLLVFGGVDAANLRLDSGESYESVSDSWSSVTAVPGGARSGIAAASDGQLVYLMGGDLAAGASDLHYAYDASLDQHTARASLSAPRSFAAGAFLNDRVYLAGGVNSGGSYSNFLEVYDPAQNLWSRAADLPLALAEASLHVSGDRLYLLGGASAPGVASAAVFEYNPAANAWRRRPDLLTAVRGALVLSDAEGLLHIVGGSAAAGSASTTHQIYSLRRT